MTNRGNKRQVELLKKIVDGQSAIIENTSPKKEKLYKRVWAAIATITATAVAVMTIFTSIVNWVHDGYQKKAEKYNNDGLEFYNQGDYEQAISYYNNAIDMEKYKIEDMDVCYYNRGRAYYQIGDYEQALSDYTSALNIKEKSKYYSERSITYEQLGDMEKCYEDALKATIQSFGD
jgi:tetratricopeptide (TPR) repeat protein